MIRSFALFTVGALCGLALADVADHAAFARMREQRAARLTAENGRAMDEAEARALGGTCAALVRLQNVPEADRIDESHVERATRDEIEPEPAPLPVIEAIEVDTSGQAQALFTALGGDVVR